MRKMFLVLMLLLFPAAGWAASFDCGKAQTKVEKLVCNTPAISKLDDEIGKLYQATINKASEEQKQVLVTLQKHWLKHTRNVCKDEVCLKLAYWSRQAELETFFEPKLLLYKHEADKAEAIKQVLATAPLYYSAGANSEINQFCIQMFDDLKQMKGIRFVDPVVQTQSYEDPELDKWKQRCEAKPPLHFYYVCSPNVIANVRNYKDALETPGCDKGFGLPPFKLYELPPEKPTGKPLAILYADDDFGSNVWEYSESYTTKYWEHIKPQRGGSGAAGFHQIDPEKCELVFLGVSASLGPRDRGGKNYNSIIEHENQYYMFILNERNTSWWLDLFIVAPYGSENYRSKNCSWTPVAPKPNTSTQGSK